MLRHMAPTLGITSPEQMTTTGVIRWCPPKFSTENGGYLPALRCQRVRFSIFLCFFFRMRLRRFLMREPMTGATVPASSNYARTHTPLLPRRRGRPDKKALPTSGTASPTLPCRLSPPGRTSEEEWRSNEEQVVEARRREADQSPDRYLSAYHSSRPASGRQTTPETIDTALIAQMAGRRIANPVPRDQKQHVFARSEARGRASERFVTGRHDPSAAPRLGHPPAVEGTEWRADQRRAQRTARPTSTQR